MIRKTIKSSLLLGLSKTARALYWVFSGNVLSIVLTFFATILVANNLSKAEYGIFISLYTLANLLSELGEAGIGAALSSFIPGLQMEGKNEEAAVFVSTAFKLELAIGGFLFLATSLLSPLLAHILFADTRPLFVVIVGVMTMLQILFAFSTLALSAYKEFRSVAFINIFYSLVRLVLLGMLVFMFNLSLLTVLSMYTLSALAAWGYGTYLLKVNLLKVKGSTLEAKRIVRFASYLAAQKVFVATSSRLAQLMLIPLSNAVEAGVFGIASWFAMVYPLFIGSLGQVIAPRFAEYKKGSHALDFFKKVALVVMLLLFSEIAFYFVANFIINMFLPKYIDALPVLQALLIATAGFIIATPFVSFLIYTLKKPVVTTVASGVQLIIIFISNLYFIPRLGRLGPAVGIGLGNVAICVIAISATMYYLRRES